AHGALATHTPPAISVTRAPAVLTASGPRPLKRNSKRPRDADRSFTVTRRRPASVPSPRPRMDLRSFRRLKPHPRGRQSIFSADLRDDRVDLRQPRRDGARAEVAEQGRARRALPPSGLALDLLRLAPRRRLERVPARTHRRPEGGEV